MSRGFLKDIGGSKRMRFVKPGYDANDLNVPANAVIFDSEDAGGLFIYRAGTWSGTIPKGAGGFIVSWPSLGYTPLAVVQDNSMPGGVMRPFVHYGYSFSDSALTVPRIIVYPTGLWLRNGRDGVQPGNEVWNFIYQVYRQRAQ